MPRPERIAIIGAGPTGLGAAWRLLELGREELTIFEASGAVGGLSSSVVDGRGFTWDMGGHVEFSHYPYYDRVLDELLAPHAWLRHERVAAVRVQGRFVPYPFQYNIHRLPAAARRRCLKGLEEAAKRRTRPEDFARWILASFGKGIADLFMTPYNRKVWAWPLEELSYGWVGDRVAVTDLARLRRTLRTGQDDADWGPNRFFRFPARGGTGAIWRAAADRIGPGRIRLRHRLAAVDPRSRTLRFSNGRTARFDALLNTSPLDLFARCVAGLPESALRAARRLRANSTHVVGIGLSGRPPEALADKCWMYFPESAHPFYRLTVFSRYSPDNVPAPGRQWSLMAEVNESPFQPARSARIAADAVRSLRREGLLPSGCRVLSLWHRRLLRGYPLPTLDRDEALGALQRELERLGLQSRGRFGGWRYEVGNQDHSFMQGVEWADRLLRGRREKVYRAP
ncbi:MAG TPA: amine oxidase [Elusimicrobia bacterium]|nr:amine oxidase [Elusimicrobiota bacterium]